ncbi:MAG: 30S ribosomal protein S5 [Bacteriovoracaceae bacterium]|nr:30S ribosomal protein S5 [Bacteriovoracaceae bacterium]
MTDEVKKENGEAENKEALAKKKKRAPFKKKVEALTAPEDGMAVDVEERIVAVNRVAKVVKGGRRFSFSALMVVGDKHGHVGYGLGKAKEVPDAIRKATKEAQKKMIFVPTYKGTIPHEILGKFGAGKILFKPAAEGTGIKAAGACRSILELVGIKNVLTKSLRRDNPHNVVKATFDALKNLRSMKQIAGARGKEIKALKK